MNSSRHIPPTPAIYQRVSQENRLFIFNVGPWRHKRELGSAGTFFIPACPEGKDYSDPVIIMGVVEEPYPINEVKCENLITEGTDLANQVLGEGPFIPKSTSFRPFGVFISNSEKPTKEELAAAKAELAQKYLELVNEASTAFANGHKEAQEVIRPEWHFVAARALRKSEAECPWLGNTQTPAARSECPGCGVVYKVGVIKCKDCGFVLDKPRYDKAVKDGMFS